MHASRCSSWADINGFIGGEVSTCQRSGFKPGSWRALRFWLFDICVFAIRPSWPAFMLTLDYACSYCRRHHTMGFKSKTFPANGLTCHQFLEHSLLISAKVRVFVPFSCISVAIPLDVLFGRFVNSRLAALEMVTHGLARATSHRVLSPPTGSTPRYSIPFFQNIRQDLRLSEIQLNCTYAFGCS